MAKTTEQKPPIPDPYFIDIETVPSSENFPEGTVLGELFLKKFKIELEKLTKEQLWQKNAGVYAEFGKIVCISLGKVVYNTAGAIELHIKTLFNTDERELLIDFREIINKTKNPDQLILCAHNGKEFDYPWMLRRMFVHKIIPPSVLNTFGIPPYQLRLQDTVEIWSGTQWKYRASLALLCEILGLDNPKVEMDGSMVAEVYYSMYREDNSELPFDKEDRIKATIKRITDYCPEDIFALVNLYCRLRGFDIIKREQIFYAK